MSNAIISYEQLACLSARVINSSANLSIIFNEAIISKHLFFLLETYL